VQQKLDIGRILNLAKDENYFLETAKSESKLLRPQIVQMVSFCFHTRSLCFCAMDNIIIIIIHKCFLMKFQTTTKVFNICVKEHKINSKIAKVLTTSQKYSQAIEF
jgi:hypothetical protein